MPWRAERQECRLNFAVEPASSGESEGAPQALPRTGSFPAGAAGPRRGAGFRRRAELGAAQPRFPGDLIVGREAAPGLQRSLAKDRQGNKFSHPGLNRPMFTFVPLGRDERHLYNYAVI